jgi:hypothetical protein
MSGQRALAEAAASARAEAEQRVLEVRFFVGLVVCLRSCLREELSIAGSKEARGT